MASDTVILGLTLISTIPSRPYVPQTDAGVWLSMDRSNFPPGQQSLVCTFASSSCSDLSHNFAVPGIGQTIFVTRWTNLKRYVPGPHVHFSTHYQT
ncbi:hypothetical protein BV25DRAFT_1606285 [Artomyces pyxidatus]|uniref:Uncharacterized protein n=1 Tax=Artomyces pyxidatus TaxID=48021 RepID=A0ACB8TBH6_9AGAM|nr:hypothetical protein BV25DRAFT_1606285 [Artomyces pyxidatus]